LIFRLEEGAARGVSRVEGKWCFAWLPFGHPDAIEILVCLLLECVDLVLGECGHRDALDAVTELAVDAAAVRADEDGVGGVNVDGTLLAAIRAFLVGGATHQSAECLLLLLLECGVHRGSDRREVR
jgi:hypothetical protein